MPARGGRRRSVWASAGLFSSIARTPAELSIVCAAEQVPAAVPAERGFRALAVRGPLDFGLVAVVAQLSGALAAASISIFVVSTHDTDYLFVRDADSIGRPLRFVPHNTRSSLREFGGHCQPRAPVSVCSTRFSASTALAASSNAQSS